MPISRGSFAALTACISLGTAIFFSLYSLIPVTRSDTPNLGSLFVGIMMGCVIAVQPVTPVLVGRLSLRHVLTLSSMVLAVGALITGTAPNTIALITGAVVSGISFGTLIVSGSQGVALLVAPGRLGKSLGTFGLFTMFSSAIGSPFGVQLAVSTSPVMYGWCALAAGLVAAAASFGIPAAVGRSDHRPGHSESGQQIPPTPFDRRTASRPLTTPGFRGLTGSAPWMALAFLLCSILLLSHGLTSLPVLAAPAVNAAVVVFAVQAGNALGRGLGGQVEARLSARFTLLIGMVLLLVGGILGVMVHGVPAALLSGVCIGLGVGIVQTLTLHTAMLRMEPGRASVVWNLGVDGGLWIGGILWGLALDSHATVPVALLVCTAVLFVGLFWRPGLPPRRGSARQG